MKIPALSLTQPWSSLVACSAKTIETRSWSTSYRGPLAIHASKSFPVWARACCAAEPFRSTLAAAGITDWRQLPTGVVLATCTLVTCAPTRPYAYAFSIRDIHGRRDVMLPPEEPEGSFGDYGPNRFAWILDDIKALAEPFHAKGALGLWDCEMEMVPA